MHDLIVWLSADGISYTLSVLTEETAGSILADKECAFACLL